MRVASQTVLRSRLREEEKVAITKMYKGRPKEGIAPLGCPTIARILKLRTYAVIRFLSDEGIYRTKNPKLIFET